jgi:hypothetical protein
MTSRELWQFDQEPKLTLSTGETVHVELWRRVSEIQARGVRLSIALNGHLKIDRAERLLEGEAEWLEENCAGVSAVLDDERQRGTPQ